MNCPFLKIVDSIRDGAFPPFYYLLMNVWTRIFGETEFTLRFPSVIFSTLSIILIFKLVKELYDERIALYAALLSSIAPYGIYYAQEAKMYSMLWFLGILSFIYLFRFKENLRVKDLILYCLFAASTIYTLYVGFIFIIIHNLFFFSLCRGRAIKKWLFGQLAIVLLYLPWINKCLFDLSHRAGINWIPRTNNYYELFSLVYSRVLSGYANSSNTWELAVYSILLFSAFVSVKNKGKKYALDFKRNDFLVVVWIIVPVALYWLINKFFCAVLSERTTRYIGFLYIPLCILIGKGLGKYRVALRSIILLFLLWATLSYRIIPLYKLDYRLLYCDNWRSFSYELQKRADDKALLVTGLVPYVVSFYNKGYQIQPLRYLDVLASQPLEKIPDSVFVIYRGNIDKDTVAKKLNRYKLNETFFSRLNGFLWFKKRT